MNLQDLVVTPIYFVLILIGAFYLRRYFTNDQTRKYFIPALFLKMVSAILVGILYQFYYGGGDTFHYHTYGSAILAKAIVEDPLVGWKLFFSDNSDIQGAYQYYSNMTFFQVPKVFWMMRIGTLFDLLTFRTYSATALFFALFSFSGLWYLYAVLEKMYSQQSRILAIAILYIPTVIFWGSGIFRDTLVLGALAAIVAIILKAFYLKKLNVWDGIILLGGVYLIYTTKVYVIACLIPFFGVLFLSLFLQNIPSLMARLLLFIPVALIVAASTYLLLEYGIAEDSQYSLDRIAETARITAYDIGFYTGRSAGSGYSLGELDGTFIGLIKLAPAGINVTLFRPYLWEVRNPLMLLSAFEAFILLALTLYLCYKTRLKIIPYLFRSPAALALMTFALTFAFAVGVSTFNFGTLSRYKIPVIPFFLIALIITYHDYRLTNSPVEQND